MRFVYTFLLFGLLLGTGFAQSTSGTLKNTSNSNSLSFTQDDLKPHTDKRIKDDVQTINAQISGLNGLYSSQGNDSAAYAEVYNNLAARVAYWKSAEAGNVSGMGLSVAAMPPAPSENAQAELTQINQQREKEQREREAAANMARIAANIARMQAQQRALAVQNAQAASAAEERSKTQEAAAASRDAAAQKQLETQRQMLEAQTRQLEEQKKAQKEAADAAADAAEQARQANKQIKKIKEAAGIYY